MKNGSLVVCRTSGVVLAVLLSSVAATSCNEPITLGSNDHGGGPSCNSPSDCPAPAPCFTATCVNGACGTSADIGATCSAAVPACCSGVCVDLTSDLSNCGSCAHSCEPDLNHIPFGTCHDSACVVPLEIASDAWGICGMVIDGTNAYWGDATANKLMKTPLAGGSSTEIAPVQMSGNCAIEIAVDATTAYWTNLHWVNDQNAGGGDVTKAPIAGGKATRLSTSSQNTPGAIAVLGTNLYWLNYGPPLEVPVDTDGTLMTMPTAGGAPASLAKGLGLPRSIAVTAQNVYWTDAYVGAVMQVPRDGGTPVEIASAAMPEPIAIDATNIYWGELGSNRIMKAPLAGGPAVQLVVDTDAPDAIAVDSTTLYWVTHNTLKKATINGGMPTLLAMTGIGPTPINPRIAVDATNVYWTARIDNHDILLKSPK